MKRILTAVACALLAFSPACTDEELALFFGFFGQAEDVPPLQVEGGVTSDDPARIDAALFTLRIVNPNNQSADVTVHMMLGDRNVHFSILRVRGGSAPVVVGPELASMITIEGFFADGTPIEGATFRFGPDFDTETVREFLLTVASSVPDEPPPPQDMPDDDTPPVPDDMTDDDVIDDDMDDMDDDMDDEEPPSGGGGPPAIVDCNENGIDDAIDLANCMGDPACGDCNGNGIPDGCEDVTPEECCTPIAIGDEIDVNTPFEGAGVIDVPGGNNCFVFNGLAGQLVYFDSFGQFAMTPSFCLTAFIHWSLTDPTGKLLFPPVHMGDDAGAFELPADGSYTINVQATPGATGTFGFRTIDVGDPVDNFTISIGDTVGPGDPGPGAGDIEVPFAGEDVYTFTAPPGQLLFFDAQQTNTGLNWNCVDENSSTLFSQTFNAFGDPGLMELTQGGTYTVTVSTFGAGTGEYAFELLIPPPPENFVINLDERVELDMPITGAGHIGAPGERDIYSLDIASSTDAYFDEDTGFNGVRWRAFDPSGALLFDQSMGSGDPGLFSLETTGTYTIEVFHPNQSNVQYAFEVLTPPTPENFIISVGDLVTLDVPSLGAGFLDSPLAQDDYVLATSPQTVYIDAVSSDFELQWTLLDSQGMSVVPPQALDPFSDIGRVFVDSGYTISVSSNNGGGFFEFRTVMAPPVKSSVINLDEPVSGSYGTVGQVDEYAFTAPPSGEVFFDAVDTAFFSMLWELRPSEGAPIFGPRPFDPVDDPGSFTLNPGSSYVVRVFSEGGENTIGDDYEFQVLTLPQTEAFSISIGDAVTLDVPSVGAGFLETPATVDQYVFSAMAGDTVFFDAQIPTDFGADWELRDPMSQLIFGPTTLTPNSDPGAFTLPVTGDYTISVTNFSGEPSIYSFELAGPLPAPEMFTYLIGDIVGVDDPGPGAGSLDQVGARDVYTFDVSQPQTLYFDAISATTGTVTWQCERPSGGFVFFETTLSQFNDPGPRFLNEVGTYTITVFNNGPPADYEFQARLLNDRCDEANCALDGGFENLFSTIGATTDEPGDCNMDEDVWFEYFSTCTTDVTFSLCGADFDTVLAVYEGCMCPVGQLVACNDDACGAQSEITVPVTAGTCYRVRVGGSDDAGAGALVITGCDGLGE